MTNDPVIVSYKESIAHIQLNRADALNAVNGDLCAGLKQAVIDAEQNDTVKALLISGNGRAFCAGGDLNSIKQLCDADADELYATLTRDFSVVEKIYQCTKPTIAAVHGSVVGGGCGISAACDFVVAQEGTRFVFPFLDLGIIPDMCILFVLTQRIGLQKARNLLLRGVSISADQAHHLGLVDELSLQGNVINDAFVLADELAKRAGPAMTFAKQHLNQIGQYSFSESMEKEILKQTVLWKTNNVSQRADEMLNRLANKKNINSTGD